MAHFVICVGLGPLAGHNSKRMSRYLAALMFAFVCLTVKRVAAENAGPSAQPNWIVSLKKYGYRGPHNGLINDPGSLGNIAFSKSTVAVIFDEKSEEVQRAATDKTVWYGWRLSIVFLNAATGAVTGKRSWIGDLDWHRRLIPTADGNFVFLLTKFPGPIEMSPSNGSKSKMQEPHPATLYLLSSTGDELKRLDLSTNGKGWQILASPSGKSVLLMDEYNGSIQFRLLDADTLEQHAVWSIADTPNLRPSAISDEYLLLKAGKESLIEKFTSESRKVPLPLGNTQFLSGDLILTVTPPTLGPSGSATISNLRGEEVASIDLVIHDRMEGAIAPIVAADGQRFGTIIDQITVGHFLRKYQRTVYVWERPRNGLVLKTRIPYSERPEAAISADGSALIVLNAGKVAMYRLSAPRASSR
jgi:hypothetical protein